MPLDANSQTWTSAQLLSDVRRKASLPALSTDFTDAVLMREATDVLWSFAGWALAQAGDGRQVDVLERVTTTASLLSSAQRAGSEVDMPPLAGCDTIESVSYVDASGQSESRLQRIDASVQSDFSQPGSQGTPAATRSSATGCASTRSRRQRHAAHSLPASSPDAHRDALGRGPLITNAAFSDGRIPALTISSGPLGRAGGGLDLVSPTPPYRTLKAIALVLSYTVSTPATMVVSVPARFSRHDGARATRSRASRLCAPAARVQGVCDREDPATSCASWATRRARRLREKAALDEMARLLGMLSPRAKRDRPKAVNPYSHLRGGMRGGWRT